MTKVPSWTLIFSEIMPVIQQGVIRLTSFTGIKLDAHSMVILRDFPQIIVHEVWVGVMTNDLKMTPVQQQYVGLFDSKWDFRA